MDRLLALLLIFACAGCAGVNPDVISQHLVADAPCFAAAAQAATTATENNVESLFGLKKGQASAVTVLNALASGKASEVPLALFTACQGFLANVKADIAAIKGKVK